LTVEIIHFDTVGIIGFKKNSKALLGSQATIEDVPSTPNSEDE